MTDTDTETRATYGQFVGAVILNLNELAMTLVHLMVCFFGDGRECL